MAFQTPIEPIVCACGFTISPGSQQRRWFRHVFNEHPETWEQIPPSATKASLATKFIEERNREVNRHPNKGRKQREKVAA